MSSCYQCAAQVIVFQETKGATDENAVTLEENLVPTIDICI